MGCGSVQRKRNTLVALPPCMRGRRSRQPCLCPMPSKAVRATAYVSTPQDGVPGRAVPQPAGRGGPAKARL